MFVNMSVQSCGSQIFFSFREKNANKMIFVHNVLNRLIRYLVNTEYKCKRMFERIIHPFCCVLSLMNKLCGKFQLHKRIFCKFKIFVSILLFVRKYKELGVVLTFSILFDFIFFKRKLLWNYIVVVQVSNISSCTIIIKPSHKLRVNR